ncbi:MULTISPECIES: hypothetical protein [unclassified Treponema]|uniref:hypothetical protein n=1 Tax=unclassified Treponema TaxID=2638727 RepID=UPI0020A2B727|nr:MULTISPECIES: hypothetical protein [unclassified Treponema]UTC67143.1 hypothetical protein E4O06_00265 [Treponema sp. OMZ 789]UTC69873.1 hypothetical protein E4O01_00265 [Treponema sp. OMZ 790]UTC72588.1 hypothetical protein E4O02_00265 [Treponema sp. OMZ 791]
MAIQPIDLQTLYAQMAKVGKQQGAEQQVTSMIRDAQQQQNKIDAQKKLSTVQLVESDNNKNLRINKDGKSPDEERNNDEEGKNQPEPEEKNQALNNEDYIKDPYLGQRVDISG